jgi:hypothetical protein
MKKSEIILALLFVSDSYLSEVVKPAVYYFHNPSSWLSVRVFPIGVILLFGQIFSSWSNMGYVSSLGDNSKYCWSYITCIKTNMLLCSFWSLHEFLIHQRSHHL